MTKRNAPSKCGNIFLRYERHKIDREVALFRRPSLMRLAENVKVSQDVVELVDWSTREVVAEVKVSKRARRRENGDMAPESVLNNATHAFATGTALAKGR